MSQYFLIYMLVAGLVSFVLFGVDKYKARREKWRISEKHLLLSMALGGRLGGVIGMQVFHHKTIKSSFLWKFWLIVIAWIIISVVVMSRSV